MRGAEGGGGMVEKINKILKISAGGEGFMLRNARSHTRGSGRASARERV